MQILGVSLQDNILPASKFLFNATPQSLVSSPSAQYPSMLELRPGLPSGFYKSLIWVNRKPGCRNSSRSLGVQCSHNVQNDDGFYMRRCVELARKAIGFASPNPMVGCVIVKDGEVVGEGFHPKAGQPHAEVHSFFSF